MRAWWIAVGLAASWGAGAGAEPKPVRVLGFLTEQADKQCVDGRVEWVNPHPEVGFTRVVGTDVALEALQKRAVIVTGREAKDAAPPVKYDPECPMMQMRSDWVEGRDGIRVERVGRGVAAMHVTSAAPWDGLAAKVKKGALVVTLKEDLGAPVSVTVHYEGCYGKPGATARTLAAKPGKALRFPLADDELHDKPRKGMEEGIARHVPVSVTLSGDVPGLVLALDLPLWALGVSVECPKR